MKRPPLRSRPVLSTPAALALLLLAALAAPAPAHAGHKGDAAGGLLFLPTILALVLLPMGLAVQGLVLAFSPRRGRSLVRAAVHHRVKTIVLGLLNTACLGFVVIAAGQRAPALSVLTLAVWLGMVLVGAHGLSRDLGARVLGRERPAGPPLDALEAALGWAVLLFASAVPVLGLLLAAYWTIRAAGAAVLGLLAVEVPAAEADLEDDLDPKD
ncbi:MAG: hypothetical protein AB7N76_13175 [Planctomycetota bacterium]